jgi:hypothetical protein
VGGWVGGWVGGLVVGAGEWVGCGLKVWVEWEVKVGGVEWARAKSRVGSGLGCGEWDERWGWMRAGTWPVMCSPHSGRLELLESVPAS